MTPEMVVQNKIEVVFVNLPGPDTLKPENGEEGGE